MLATTGVLLLGEVSHWTTGAPHVAGIDGGRQSNVYLLGRSVYTTYLFPFEATAALLVIAVVGAVVLARRPPTSANPAVEDDGETTGPGDPPPAESGDPAPVADPAPGPTRTGRRPAAEPGGSAEPAVTADPVSSTEEARS